MGDESRWNDQQSRDWGDRYQRRDPDQRDAQQGRDDRRYGAGDFEGSRYDRYDQSPFSSGQAAWPRFEPGRDSPDYRERGGEEHGWERAASQQGYGPATAQAHDESRRESARSFGGWDAPFGGRPTHQDERREEARDRPQGEGRSFIDRTRDELASLFGAPRRDEERRDPGYAAARREGDHRGRGPRGYRRSDERIREDVNERLTEDSWLDASSIEVTVYGGEVTLDGVVHSRADKRRAEDIAERVSGVGHVQNNLRAEGGRDWREEQPMSPFI